MPFAGSPASGSRDLCMLFDCPLHTVAGRAIFLNERPGRGVYT